MTILFMEKTPQKPRTYKIQCVKCGKGVKGGRNELTKQETNPRLAARQCFECWIGTPLSAKQPEAAAPEETINVRETFVAATLLALGEHCELIDEGNRRFSFLFPKSVETRIAQYYGNNLALSPHIVEVEYKRLKRAIGTQQRIGADQAPIERDGSWDYARHPAANTAPPV